MPRRSKRRSGAAVHNGARNVMWREGGKVQPIMANEEPELSVLADFDTGDVLNALSSGIIVLDEQLCAIYANDIAQDLLAVRLEDMRGQPLEHFLTRPQRFAEALRRALRRGAAVDYRLDLDFEGWRATAEAVNVRIAPLWNRVSGAYVLVEISARTCIQLREPTDR